MSLQLEVGKYYANRDGNVLKIKEEIPGELSPLSHSEKAFRTTNDQIYFGDGECVRDVLPNTLGLVREVAESDLLNGVDHPEIGYDEPFATEWKDIPISVTASPHLGREIGLLKAGLKPLAVVSPHSWSSDLDDYARAHNWLVLPREKDGRLTSLLVAISGQHWRIDAYQNLKMAEHFPPHFLRGILLGYRQSDITAFLEWKKENLRIKKIRESRKKTFAQLIMSRLA
jgi:hypothetical protein